jgi:hypothetical protein
MEEPITRYNGRPIPAKLLPYVQTLGVEDAIKFFLALGGSHIYLPGKARPGSRAATVLGAEKLEKLTEWFGIGYVKVPLGSRWIAEVMFADGTSTNRIAALVRSDVATVRRWINYTPGTPAKQLPASLSARQ